MIELFTYKTNSNIFNNSYNWFLAIMETDGYKYKWVDLELVSREFVKVNYKGVNTQESVYRIMKEQNIKVLELEE